MGKVNPYLIFVFLILILAIVFYKARRLILYKFHGEFDRLEEEINLLTLNIEDKNKLLGGIPLSCRQNISLFDISRRMIEFLDPQEVYEFLIKVLKDLFPQADSILLFIFDNKESVLSLVSSFNRQNSPIDEKEGCVLDHWVLRHNQSLLVGDLKKDFRFDYFKTAAFKERGMSAFVASPLSIADRVTGVVRLEHREPLFFSLDDSRLLRNICDLTVLVLERAKLFNRTQELAIKDSLTGLFMRDYFMERLKEEINRAQLKNSEIGIIMLDIDGFKAINDTYGHIVGDLALKRLSRILQQVIGDSGNLISRFGGEEFIIFMVECDKERLLCAAEQIRRRVEETVISFRRKQIGFTVSLGCVLFPVDSKDIIDLIDKADKCLYLAKAEGKNKARCL